MDVRTFVRSASSVHPSLSRLQHDLFGIRKGELRALQLILSGNPPHAFAHVEGKPKRDPGLRSAGEYIALQGRSKSLILQCVQGCTIDSLPAIERLPNPSHGSRNRKIAHAYLTHVAIQVPAERIKQSLAEGAEGGRPSLEVPQNEDHVEHDHFQSAADRIRYPIELVKGGGSRLCHDRAIETRDGIVRRGGAKQLQ